MYVTARLRLSLLSAALIALFAAGCSMHSAAPLTAQLQGATSHNVRGNTVGSLYVAASGSHVYAFAPGQTMPKLVITNGINKPTYLIFDSSNNLYVANAGPGSTGSVTEYTNGQGSPTRTITTGVNAPTYGSLAVSPDGTLIVASQAGISEYHPGATRPFFNKSKPSTYVVAAPANTIDVTTWTSLTSNFPLGKWKPNFSFNAGVAGALGIDTAGTLYIVDASGPGAPVREFDATGKFIRLLGNGIDIPVSVFVDSRNNAWVNNFGEITASISGFHQNADSPFISITQGINSVNALTVDSAGTLYIANGGGGKLIREYANGSTTPTLSFPLRQNQVGTSLVIAPPGI
jgi:hypothetical protein